MNTHTYVFVYVCICMYIPVCIYSRSMCLSICIRLWMCIYPCTRIRICICPIVHACIGPSIGICTYVYLYCTSIYMFKYMYTYTFTNTYTYTYMYMYVHVHTVYDPEPEQYSNKTSELEPSSIFPVPQPWLQVEKKTYVHVWSLRDRSFKMGGCGSGYKIVFLKKSWK